MWNVQPQQQHQQQPDDLPRTPSPSGAAAVMSAAIAQFNQSGGMAKEDPPIASSGYWDYDESTGKKYWVNWLGEKKSSKAKEEFYSMDREELLRFQELAFQAGYYGPSAEREDVPWGSYDDDTFKHWDDIVDRAARMFKAGKKHSVWDILQDDVNHRPESLGKDKKANRQPLVTRLPDPREVEEMVRGVAPSVIGRDADPAFTQDFIAMYTNIVSRFQEQEYALKNTEEGGTITAPPSAEALASFRLRTENPEQYEELRAAQRADAYTKLLKGAL